MYMIWFSPAVVVIGLVAVAFIYGIYITFFKDEED